MIFEAEGQLYDSNAIHPARAEVVYTASQTNAARILARGKLKKIEQVRIVKDLSGLGLMASKALVEWAMLKHRNEVPF